MDFRIARLSRDLEPALKEKIGQKTKPIGALGVLESLALQMGLIQNTLTPRLHNPVIVVFAADHGITDENISPYPRAVTAQMVRNFLSGGAAINVLARQTGIALKIVDAGVDDDFFHVDALIDAKVARGTRNFVLEPAMTASECEQAIAKGAGIAEEIARSESTVIGFGDMGIGNTSSAAILMSFLCNAPLEHCVGSGSGLDAPGLKHKVAVLEQAVRRVRLPDRAAVHLGPLELLQEFGGFEIAMICGAMLQAAAHRLIVLVDGFIATAALLVATRLNEHVLDYCVFSHRSEERGHRSMLEYLGAEPLLDLRLRLGEGTGAALAYPIVAAAVAFMNDMASFADAGVSGKKA